MALSAVSSIETSNCPALHLGFSVNCSSAEFSLVRIKSISKLPEPVAQNLVSATIEAVQVHGAICRIGGRISRTFRNDNTGSQVTSATAVAAVPNASGPARNRVRTGLRAKTGNKRKRRE